MERIFQERIEIGNPVTFPTPGRIFLGGAMSADLDNESFKSLTEPWIFLLTLIPRAEIGFGDGLDWCVFSNVSHIRFDFFSSSGSVLRL